MNPDVDYANLYRDLSSKFKKKLFRKTNLTEAKDDFAKSLATEDTPEYAGVFALGKAKCEAQLNNAIGEAAALLEAAAWFLRAEENLVLTGGFSVRENLDFFVSCSLKAAKVRTDAPRSMHILSKCARCQIFMRDYVGALTTYQRMQALILDAYATHNYEQELLFDYTKSCEIFRVLLILLTTPPPSLKHDSEQVGAYSLKAYLTGEQVPSESCAAGLLDSDLFLLLRSLIMAYKSSNITELEYTATYLQSHVSLVQRKLLCDLLEELINPLGG
ncbi:unnamed protein product [Dibothriocephalus latus]|uniref:Factor VIII intron 22 protein n=1 Tax=Dibothriocephalus latus TaxID=60516 RepID=A0A3P7LPT6_DIBLA|nr:unnamed protein product [Dibothriocephalus latus]